MNAAEPPRSARTPEAARRCILVIEDDTGIAAALRTHLEGAGYAVVHEADGRAAMRAVEQPGWDLVLLDLMLPGADGWDVCRHLRQHQPEVPVIMLSARGEEAHRVLGLELGADDYLAKPYSMIELLARVRALFRRLDRMQLGQPPATLRFGRWRFEPASRLLVDESRGGGGGAVPLTQREAELLHFLAARPGRTFGRDELLRRVWGSGFDGYEHTVNSHINRLRAKVEPDPREPRHLLTVWGQGYRFDAGAPEGAASA
jgi:DNA-binding response OmpR family regulator